ncbi:hypothetical protein MF406_03520 [Georgenia sp. TF02-10]|uniref:hypothetical protein n=1 Tax=Georgenia sp. TF02-10 TaxID=2917725 RepID=UPI001FA7554B|nr:hypothetical protein [Georgenia sp. TF02-10]UNX56547.1 hypothetical protein MF406_03520 [Georgenia sp. TF02-10]
MTTPRRAHRSARDRRPARDRRARDRDRRTLAAPRPRPARHRATRAAARTTATPGTARPPRPRRALARVGLAVAALGLAAAGLAPTGATEARWYDAADVAVPALTTDTVALTAAPATTERATTLTAGQSTITWAPTAVTVTAGGAPVDPAVLSGTTIDYVPVAAGAACPATAAGAFRATPTAPAAPVTATGPEQRLTLPAGTSAQLCAVVTPSLALRTALAGQTLALTTTLDSRSPAPATWQATTGWATTYQVPAAPTLSGPTCSPVNPWKVRLSWAWTEQDGSPSTVPVTAWELQRRTVFGWVTLQAGIPAAARDTTLTGGWAGAAELRVVGTGPGGTTITSTGTASIWTVVGVVRCA